MTVWKQHYSKVPKSWGPIRARPSDIQKYFLFVHGQMEEPRYTLQMLLTAVKKPPTNCHAAKKKPWLAATCFTTCKTAWPLGAIKYLQDYFLLSSSNDFDTTALVVQEKREGKMSSLSKIAHKCSHYICSLPIFISSQEHSYLEYYR